jgi:hypothetical protein
MVSALGSTVAFALTDRNGRFVLDALPPGPYTVRVHLDGFAPARQLIVDVQQGLPSMVSVALHAPGKATTTGTAGVLAAGLVPIGEQGTAPTAGLASDPDETENHSEAAWRLRHLKRSVLKTEQPPVTVDGVSTETPADGAASFLSRAFDPPARLVAAIFDELTPLSGQINFLTTGSFDSPADLWSRGALAPASIAYISVGSSVGRLGEWSVRGATARNGVGSWFVAGSFAAHPGSSHRYVSGVVYSTQQFDTSNPVALAAIRTTARSLGALYAFDEWAISRRVTLGYGSSYVWQDYLHEGGLLSPRMSLTLTPVPGVRVRGVAARYAVAPGAEEFLPRASGSNQFWLPAQRTFSPWSSDEGFRAETTEHIELAVERDLSSYVLGFRTFYQRVDDQAGAVFAAPTPNRLAASLGHYYVATAGDLKSRGWGVSISRSLAGPVRGSIDYSLSTTQWDAPAMVPGVPFWGEGRRPDAERVHDLTTSVETEIPQTATRVFVLYKLNTGFAREDTADGNGFDTRFDVQVNQPLPFLNFTSADWEVLVAVCNLFRDVTSERSLYDELLVIRPPKRVVGGVRVRF